MFPRKFYYYCRDARRLKAPIFQLEVITYVFDVNNRKEEKY